MRIKQLSLVKFINFKNFSVSSVVYSNLRETTFTKGFEFSPLSIKDVALIFLKEKIKPTSPANFKKVVKKQEAKK